MKDLKYYCNIILVITVFLSFLHIPGKSQQWEPVPMVSQKIKDAGHFGGEGLQWPQAIEIDIQDGSFILYGTDVGGIFRSTNGGEMFEPANVGYNARGNSDFAIDPENNTRAVAVGANSGANPQHGLYLTTDQGASWTHVLPFGDYNGYRDIRDQVQYDPTSYDSELGYCTDIYWSKINMNGGGGLFKSTDGGYTWTKISDEFGSCIMKIHQTRGYIYLANGDLYRSADGGASFEMIEEGIIDIDVIEKLPDNIYALKAGGLYLSTDTGNSFNRVPTAYFPDSNPNHLYVNPLHPDTMVMANFEPKFNYSRHYTHDGGQTWFESDIDNSLAWGAYNRRPSFFAWSPVEPGTVWSVGGAWATRSIDGGKVFQWSSNGLNIVMTGGIFNINPNQPDNIFIGFQDQNAAFSKNAGYTWKYCNVSGKGWGGHCYGGYAANENILLTGLADSWNGARELRISFDGGDSWTGKGVVNEGIDIAYGDPVDENILFFGNYRSADRGDSWFPMEGCDGVCTSNPQGYRELYGVKENSAVVSFDKGLTWETIASFDLKVLDVAFDHHRKKVYVALRDGGFWVVNKNGEKEDLTPIIPRDQYNSPFKPRSVTVDPVKPEVVYAGQARGPYKTDVSVVRSVDAGKNWQVFNRNKRLNNIEFGIPGGQTATSLRVNPGNRYLYVGTGCFGTWRIGPPDSTDPGPPIVVIDTVQEQEVIVKDTVVLNTNVINDQGLIDTVKIYINQQKVANLLNEPYSFEWIPEEAGDYEIMAEAVDSAGNIITADPLIITVLTSALPRVTISSPENQSEYDYVSDVEIIVDAVDPDGNIKKVEFYMDSVLIGQDSLAPFSFLLDDISEGTYSIMASATDNTEQTVFSSPVFIKIKEQVYSFFYKEDFNDGLAQGWDSLKGIWLVEENSFRKTGDEGVETCIFNGYIFKDFRFLVKAKPELSNYFGIVFNYQDEENYYLLMLDAYPSLALLYEVIEGEEILLTQEYYAGEGAGNWIEIELFNDGSKSSVFIDGKAIMFEVPCLKLDSGRIGLYTRNNSLWFDDVEVAAKEATLLSSDNAIRNNDGGMIISPNPVLYTNFTVKTSLKKPPYQICIFDIGGKEVFSAEIKNDYLDLPAEILNPGVFIVRIYNDNHMELGKLIKH